eukprot:TRINITY_DN6198_c0_g1_i1.p1 TRINITY_DN6198_c0_g1~~TRINITY_DN6198_c0_g1_i1.p1  ORF type:complete len:322 (+),score=56.82 TRINITY_DN6198_c0_g1_i1:59-1024(+)
MNGNPLAAAAGFAAGTAVGGACMWRMAQREKIQAHKPFKNIETVAIYGGSSATVDPQFLEIAVKIGKGVAERGWDQLNGGGSVGMMGAATDGGVSADGTVNCVILDKFLPFAHKALNKVTVAYNMSDRKKGLYENSDAFISLPGGLGTIEEIMEVLSWRQLGFHERPVVLINTNGFYNHLAEFLEHCIKSGFVSTKVRSCFLVTEDVEECLDFIQNYKPEFIDKTEIHQGVMRQTETDAARAAGLPTLSAPTPTPLPGLVIGARVVLVKPLRLQRTGTLAEGSVGIVTAVPGEGGSIAEVDFDDGPLTDVFPGTVKVLGTD